jgi:hypothetical protein
MNKFMMLWALCVSCASSSYMVKKQNSSSLKFCLEASKVIHRIGIKEPDLALWRSNSSFINNELNLKSGVSPTITKRIEVIAETTKNRIADSLPSDYPKSRVDEFVSHYLAFCMGEQAGVFKLDGKEYLTFAKIKQGKYDRDELESLDAHQMILVEEPINALVLAYEEHQKNDAEVDIDLGHSFTLPLTFTYTPMEGASKFDAQNLRKTELAKFYKTVLYTIASFVASKPIRNYLVKNVPLPIHENRDFPELKRKINGLLEQVEEIDPLTADTEDERIERFGEELGRSFLGNGFSYTESSTVKGHNSYEYRLNQNVSSLETRTELFVLYLLWASKVDINRSPDGKSVTFNVVVDLPNIFKRFKFEPIKQHLEQ